MPGTLVLCASPIGNLADASPRLREAVQSADLVYAEDTRRSRILLEAMGVSRPLRSYFAGNEAARALEIAEHLEKGGTVALLTDAGVPAVSDPGLSAVRAARQVGATVTVVPGPSAVTAALAVSGLPSERFAFEGFLPRRGASRRRRLAVLADEERTVVLFASPQRVVEDLEDLAAALGGDRALVVAREMTKAHEEVWHGTLAEGVERWSAAAPRGEFTLVVAGGSRVGPSLEEAVDEVLAAVDAGASTSEAVRAVAAARRVRRRALYQAVISRRTP